jgi:hypothetical protein
MFLVVRDMTMPKYNNAGIRKLLAGHTHTVMRIAQDVHNTDVTMANNHLSLRWQLQDDFFMLNIALHSHYGRYGLQLRQDRQH